MILSVVMGLSTWMYAQSSAADKEVTFQQDTAYIETFTSPLDLTARYYNSVKYSRYAIRDNRYKGRLQYRSNENLILGVGVSYRKATLNLGLNFPFVNSWDQDKKGETRYLDAQFHYYLDHYVFDAWLSTYKGYFLANPHSLTTQPLDDESYPIRPQIWNTNLSFSLMRVLNSKKFSFRSTFAQDEWQKKSAGSFLIGAEYNMVFNSADSSFIPSNMKNPDFFSGYDFKKNAVFNVGLNGGYGHTFVIARHFFISLIGTVSVGGSYTTMTAASDDLEDLEGLSWNVNYSSKVGMGYNSKTFYIGIATVQAFMTNHTPVDYGKITSNPGNVRINIVKRFVLNKPIDLPILNKILD